jgi:hypothetical protein
MLKSKETINPYECDPSPKMIPSFVCYADILGYSSMSQDAISSGIGNNFLTRLHAALAKAYERIRDNSKGFSEYSQYSVKVFTDNIVIGYPLRSKRNAVQPEQT